MGSGDKDADADAEEVLSSGFFPAPAPRRLFFKEGTGVSSSMFSMLSWSAFIFAKRSSFSFSALLSGTVEEEEEEEEDEEEEELSAALFTLMSPSPPFPVSVSVSVAVEVETGFVLRLFLIDAGGAAPSSFESFSPGTDHLFSFAKRSSEFATKAAFRDSALLLIVLLLYVCVCMCMCVE